MKTRVYPDISVIICTRNRPESLAETLGCLTRADREGLFVEIIVVENGDIGRTKSVLELFSDKLCVKYLFEPVLGNYGKSHALNRALESGRLGDIIAVLDDDMSPHVEWFKGIAESCRKWPDADVFSGRSYPIWPQSRPPDWVCHPNIMGWAFSVADHGTAYQPLSEGSTFSGNQFWFRSRILHPTRRFSDMWLTEPNFILGLTEEGRSGIWAPGAVAGHRIQPRLLEKQAIRNRALMMGQGMAELRISPHRKNKKAIMLRKYPLLSRIFCAGKFLFWLFLRVRAGLCVNENRRFALGMVALERTIAYKEMLKRANLFAEYSPSFAKNWKRGNAIVSPTASR